MRQILIHRNEYIKDITFSRLTLIAPEDIELTPGLRLIQFTVPVHPIGVCSIQFRFEPSPTIVGNQILLAGAYYDSDTGIVQAAFYNPNPDAVLVRKKTELLIAIAYEPVMLRQIDVDESPANTPATPQPPKRKRGRPARK